MENQNTLDEKGSSGDNNKILNTRDSSTLTSTDANLTNGNATFTASSLPDVSQDSQGSFPRVASKLDVLVCSMDQCSQGSNTQAAFLDLGLKQESVEFIIENGKKYLEKPLILSKKLKISQDIAIKSLNILKSSTVTTSLELTQEDKKNIDKCLSENPDVDSHEDIALLCEIDEEIVLKYFELKPLTQNQKNLIKENFDKNISVENISNILKISPKKIKDYIEMTFVTFSGDDGKKALTIIDRHCGQIPIPDLRDRIRSKNLKLQDQLCCKLNRIDKSDYAIFANYLSKYSESKEFLKVDLKLSITDILTIKQSGKDNVEQLSMKLNKVETLISDYIHRYTLNYVELQHYTELQTKQLVAINQGFGTNSFSFDKYRVIITHSFDEIISKVEDASSSKKSRDLLIDVLPLAFYYLKCSPV